MNVKSIDMSNPVKSRPLEKNHSQDTSFRPVHSRQHQEEKKSAFKEVLDRKGSSKEGKEKIGKEKEGKKTSSSDHPPVFSLFALSPNTQFDDAEDSEEAEKYISLASGEELSLPIDEALVEAFSSSESFDSDEESSVFSDAMPTKTPMKGSPYYVVSSVKEVVGETQAPEAPPETKKVHTQLVRELVSHISTLSNSDKTVTTVLLQNPPLFKGVSLEIVEFQTAPKQFNLTFHNLTNPEARALVEMQQNQEALRMALLDLNRDYAIQMITIEPKFDVELVAVLDKTESSRGDKRDERDEGEKKKGFQQHKK